MNRLSRIAVLCVALLLVACGGGTASPTVPNTPSTPPVATVSTPPGTYRITVSADFNHSTAVTLVVQ